MYWKMIGHGHTYQRIDWTIISIKWKIRRGASPNRNTFLRLDRTGRSESFFFRKFKKTFCVTKCEKVFWNCALSSKVFWKRVPSSIIEREVLKTSFKICYELQQPINTNFEYFLRFAECQILAKFKREGGKCMALSQILAVQTINGSSQ